MRRLAPISLLPKVKELQGDMSGLKDKQSSLNLKKQQQVTLTRTNSKPKKVRAGDRKGTKGQGRKRAVQRQGVQGVYILRITAYPQTPNRNILKTH